MPVAVDWLYIYAMGFESSSAAILIRLFGISYDAFCTSRLENRLLTYKTRLRVLLGKLHWVFTILWRSTFQLWANVDKILVKLITDISYLGYILLFLNILNRVVYPVGFRFIIVPMNFHVAFRLFLHEAKHLHNRFSFTSCLYT